MPGEVREVVPLGRPLRYLFVADGKVRDEGGEEWAKGVGRLVTADHGSLILQGVEESTVVQVEFV